jgi:hypothetical protein
VSPARKLNVLEQENATLKKLIAGQARDAIMSVFKRRTCRVLIQPRTPKRWVLAQRDAVKWP